MALDTHIEERAKQHWSTATFRSLRHRNFQLFLSGQMISVIGTWMQTVAQSWLVYRMTGSSLLLGVVGFTSQFPVFVIAPIGGLVADRWKRQKVVIGTQTASMILAFVLAVLTLTHELKVWEILILAALLGVVNGIDIPVRQAFLIEMVRREDLMNAIALNSSMFNGARIVGPAIAGILVATIGEGWCFFANAVSYIAVIIGLFLMRIERPSELERKESVIENLVEGFRFAHETAPIWALLLLIGLASLVGMPFSVLMPIFAGRILHGGAQALGWLMGATGVGALFGALTLATRTGVRGLARWVAVSAGAFGASLVIFGYSRWYWLSLAILVPTGYAMMLQMACTNTLIQAMAPDRLRGRLMALYTMMMAGMSPFGALFAGAFASRLGAPFTVALGGAACLAGAFLFWRYWPQMRDSARALILASGMAGSETFEQIPTSGN
ncbi:MAG: MFS transporter [Candidatus Acidiferrales bacterium]